jgi:DNA-binding transcriptional regulator LsrR (DeoR family)
VSDYDQLVQASRLYYELGETQNAIADRLGVTRPQVSRLLKRARAEGIVEIRIIDRTSVESPSADALRRSYGLDAVHLAPTVSGPEDLTRRMVGRLAAQVLRAKIRDGAIVGIGDGASVSAVADALEEAATPVAATVVPLAGGYWSPGPEREPFRRIADALGAQAHGLMAPGLVDDAATKHALEAHAGVKAILDLWRRLDVALVGIGGRSWGAASVGDEVAAELERAGAVGEMLIAPFDLDGAFVCPALRERVLAFDARALGRVPVAIGVGAGESKVRPILGALRAGAVRTLVTDVATAEAVVRLDAETLAPSTGATNRARSGATDR